MKLLDFSNQDIISNMKQVGLFQQVINGINYCLFTLKGTKHNLVLEDSKTPTFSVVNWVEEKNDQWCVLTYEGIDILVRNYRHYNMLFCRVPRGKKFMSGKTRYSYHMLSLYADTSMMGEMSDNYSDKAWDNPLLELEGIFEHLIRQLSDKNYRYLSKYQLGRLGYDTPDYLKISNGGSIKGGAFETYPNIDSIDDFVRFQRELGFFYNGLFAENTVYEMLSKLKVGQDLKNGMKILKIQTDVVNDYYHNVGIRVKGAGEDKEKFIDVYSITHWYLDQFADYIKLPK